MTNKWFPFLRHRKQQLFLFAPIAYVGLLFLLKTFRYESIFEGNALLAQIGLPSMGLFSSLECFIGSLLFLGLILNYKQGNGRWTRKLISLPIIVYGSIAVSLWLLAWALKILFFDSSLLFNFKNTIALYPQVLLNLFSAILLILGHYFGIQHLIRYMQRQQVTQWSRIMGIVAGFMLGFIALWLLPIHFSILISSSVMMAFLPLWDTYMDNRSGTLSWTLFLLLPYSLFPGVVFMKYFQQATLDQGVVQARYIVQQLGVQTEQELLQDPELKLSGYSDPGSPGFVGFTLVDEQDKKELTDSKSWLNYRTVAGGQEEVNYSINARELQMLYRSNGGPGVLLFKPLYDLFEPVAISSLFFILLLIALFIIQFLSNFGLVKEGFTIFAVEYRSLSTRIQTGTIGTILISFLFVGIVSFNFLQKSTAQDRSAPMEERIEQPASTFPSARLVSTEIDESTINFLRSLVTVYALLLCAAIVLAIIITNSITRPIASIGDMLSNFTLEENQRIQYDSQDEIGQLIGIYNQMIEKVEAQARQLKKSEREEAWREMAQQVAHEIKNPLTPMKLNVQYLMRAKDQQDPEEREQLLSRISKTLIEQIDSLSRIATEFSNFAKMPKAQLSTFSLNQLIESVYNLFKDQQSEQLSIELSLPEKDIQVHADKEQMLRVLNNLVKNGIQAIPEERAGKIAISLSTKGEEKATISVRDNGTGIPKEFHNKVFVPNFTTKSSGTGLGLAISKNIVDSVNGEIRFETEEGEGTVFYVILPVGVV
jgi:signal transduction histidine kinase